MNTKWFGIAAMLALSACIDPRYDDDVMNVFGNDPNDVYVVGLRPGEGRNTSKTPYVPQCEPITDPNADTSFCDDIGAPAAECPNEALDHAREEGVNTCRLIDVNSKTDTTLICCYKTW